MARYEELSPRFKDALDGAKIIHQGKHTAIGDVEVRDSDGALVAKSVSTYAIIKKSDIR